MNYLSSLGDADGKIFTLEGGLSLSQGCEMRGATWWAIAAILLTVLVLMPVRFSTGQPEVRRIIPRDGENLDPGIWEIEVNFTEPMNVDTLQNALIINPHVNYGLVWASPDNTSFRYEMGLNPGTYEFTLVGTVQNESGTEMGTPYFWSYRVAHDDPRGFTLPVWVGYLPGTMPFIIILLVWYVYEHERKKKLTYQQKERLEALEPRTFDKYTLLLIVLFAIVLVAAGLFYVYRWFPLFIVVAILGPALGMAAFVAFIYGMMSSSRIRQQVEMEAYGFPPPSPQMVETSKKYEVAKAGLIVGIFVAIIFALIFMIPVPGSEFNPFPLVIFCLIIGVLIALYVYVWGLERSS